MPMRTLEPETSMTSITMSSPSMTFSPGRRVMMSMGRFLLGAVWELERLGRVLPAGGVLRSDLGCRLGEQRCAHRCVGSLVDDLMTVPVRDDDRGTKIRAELLEFLRGAHGHVHGGVLALVGADALGLIVGQLDLV